MTTTELPTLIILLPVRNEKMNLRVMLRIIRTVIECPHEVLVIHNTSNDKSIPIVQELQPTRARRQFRPSSHDSATT
jgi:hypothetical protein